MTTEEIQQYIEAAIHSNFDDCTSESGELMTSEGGDGRFMGKVVATRYGGIPCAEGIYLAIGQTKNQVQIVKLGSSECLRPCEMDLDLMLLKELGVE